MKWRDPRWMQAGLDALKETLNAGGDALKQEMIDFLLDEGFWDATKLKPEAARTRFNACLNPMKSEFFKTSELVALMKRFQRYELFYWICDELGFERPTKIPNAQRRAELLADMEAEDEAYQARQAARREALAQLAELGDDASTSSLNGITRVHPQLREPGTAFCMDGEVGF